MRFLILIACLVSFTVGGFSDSAGASVVEEKMHQETHVIDVDHTNDQTEENDECQDCCCIHSHILAGPFTSLSSNSIKNHTIIQSFETFVSSEPSSLYRPPIV